MENQKLLQKLLKQYQNGEITWKELYYEYLKTEYWVNFASNQKKRINWTCQNCGTETRYLECHHRHYKDEDGLVFFREKTKDIQLLCKPCHRWVHFGGVNPRLLTPMALIDLDIANWLNGDWTITDRSGRVKRV